jgi:hypothetical protein
MKKLVSTYLKHPLIASIEFDAKQRAYTIMERGCRSKRRGLISSLQAKYYPDYERSIRSNNRGVRASQGSSKTQGITVDKQLAAHITLRKPPKNALALALIEYWDANNFQLIAAQVPTYVRQFDCVTQCDVLAYNASDQTLWMFEVKTGYPTGGFRKKGTLNTEGAVGDVPSTVYNHWQLQRHFTHIGLVDYGLDVKESRVIQVFKRKKKIVVKVHENPGWCEEL